MSLAKDTITTTDAIHVSNGMFGTVLSIELFGAPVPCYRVLGFRFVRSFSGVRRVVLAS